MAGFVVHWVVPLATHPAVDRGTLTLHPAHHGLDTAMGRAAGGQKALTGRTGQGHSAQFLGVRVLDNRLGQATGQLLAQRPDCRAHLASGRLGRRQLRLHPIEPLVKAVVKVLTQRIPWGGLSNRVTNRCFPIIVRLLVGCQNLLMLPLGQLCL
jgi:hypothetical protein